MPFQIDEARITDPQFQAGSMDIANPPVKQIPIYEFPRVLYNHKRSKGPQIIIRVNPNTFLETETHVPEKIVTMTVENKEQLDKALAQGWDMKPPHFDDVQVVEPEEQPEAPRRGRPPKAI